MEMGNIRDIRKQLGLAVDALAYKAGVSVRHLVLWEKYGLPPRNRTTIEKIARALGMDADELLAITGNCSQTNGSETSGSELKEVR
jgi:transcriptional regulator with XRE-family HTH domain